MRASTENMRKRALLFVLVVLEPIRVILLLRYDAFHNAVRA